MAALLRRRDTEVVVALLAVAGVVARLAVVQFKSADYTAFLLPWWRYFTVHGRFHALRTGFSDYTPPYLCVYIALSYAHLTPLGAIKAFGIVCDAGLAAAASRAVAIRTARVEARYAAFLAVFLAPTVFLNSAVWGQSDSFYTLFLILAVWAVLDRRSLVAAALFGAAFAIKAQSVVLAPWMLVAVIWGRVRLRHLLAVPAAYLVSIAPAWILGRPIGQLLTIYLHQAREYKSLTLNFPNLYAWLPAQVPGFRTAGICLALSVVVVLCFVAGRATAPIDDTAIVLMALVSAVVMPFVLPGMHERYMFPADILAVVFVFFRPARWWLAVVVSAISLASYLPFLFGTSIVSFPVLAVVMLAVVTFLIWELVLTLRPDLLGPRP